MDQDPCYVPVSGFVPVARYCESNASFKTRPICGLAHLQSLGISPKGILPSPLGHWRESRHDYCCYCCYYWSRVQEGHRKQRGRGMGVGGWRSIRQTGGALTLSVRDDDGPAATPSAEPVNLHESHSAQAAAKGAACHCRPSRQLTRAAETNCERIHLWR